MPPVCLAALLALCPPAPAPQLPVARDRVPRYGLVTEASLAGTTRRFRWAAAGGWVGDWEELAVGGDTGRRTRRWVLESDYWRAGPVTGPRTAGMTYQVWVANDWSVDLEAEAGPDGPRVRARVNHYPRGGVTVGVGLDSRCGPVAYAATEFNNEDLAALRFWQYVEAVRLLHGWGVVPRVLPADRK
jgi:hypothetical protein